MRNSIAPAPLHIPRIGIGLLAGALVFIFMSTTGATAQAQSDSVRGTVRVSGIFIDEEGNRAVDPFTQNLYKGVALSLLNFSAVSANGLRFTADARNLSLSNRDIALGLGKSARWKAAFSERQSRRVYTFNGDRFTRRDMYAGSFWGQVNDYIRVFADLGQTVRRGDIARGLDPSAPEALIPADYTHSHYTGGVKFGHERSMLELSYRESVYDDGPAASADQNGRRYRGSFAIPAPRYDRWNVNGGFTRFERAFRQRADSIFSNAAWGGLRYHDKNGFTAKYSFAFDRTRRTGDLVATDNIQNAITFAKNWSKDGGATLGVRYASVDDISNDLRTTGVFGQTWIKLGERTTAQGGFGDEQTAVEKGHPLTGERSATRIFASLTHREKHFSGKARIENRVTNNDDIGSKSAFDRYGLDVSVSHLEYGELRLAYDYRDGSYSYQYEKYNLQDHSLNGDFTSVEIKRMWAGASGSYTRSRKSSDAESFYLTLWWKTKMDNQRYLELAYTAYNHDQYDDPAPLYRRYYTANVAQLSLLWEL